MSSLTEYLQGVLGQPAVSAWDALQACFGASSESASREASDVSLSFNLRDECDIIIEAAEAVATEAVVKALMDAYEDCELEREGGVPVVHVREKNSRDRNAVIFVYNRAEKGPGFVWVMIRHLKSAPCVSATEGW